MVRVIYSDAQTEDYPTIKEAEENILAVFANSDGDITPVTVSEIDFGELIRDLSCSWQVSLVDA